METQMKRNGKGVLLDITLKRKLNGQDVTYLLLIITDKLFKRNTKHNYLIKKHKLNLNEKKNLHPLYVLNKIVNLGTAPLNQLHGLLYEYYQSQALLT